MRSVPLLLTCPASETISSELVRDALVRAARAEQRLERFVLVSRSPQARPAQLILAIFLSIKKAQKSARLGHVTGGGEMWQDGLELIELKERVIELESRLGRSSELGSAVSTLATPNLDEARRVALERELALMVCAP